MDKTKIWLLVIIILAAVIRLYRLDSVPPAMSWDEAAVGYNSWTIANWGRDEYGKFFPLYFRSFGEDKQPIHIYITALFVKLLGLSEFSTRLPTAVFGILNVILIFFLIKEIFGNEIMAVFSSLFLAISPQNIFFSRFNHEANFALFFFMLGLLFFFKAMKKKKDLLPISFLFFILSLISYHAAEIFIPIFVFLLIFLYAKKISEDKANIFILSSMVAGLLILIIFQPRLFGISRFNQTVQGRGDIEKTEIFKKTHNYFLGRINLALTQYSWHFDPKFLFISGDKNPRLSSQGVGEFYQVDIFLLIAGVFYLVLKGTKESILILTWALAAPLPSALFAEAPHAGRAAFMMGSWQIISAAGLYCIFILAKKKIFRITILIATFLVLTFSLLNYLNYYFNEFTRRYAIDWQYGMKQAVGYVNSHPEYSAVHITDVRGQPYIFFLYYLKTPLPLFLNSVIFNNLESKSFNNISSFDKYFFGGSNLIESIPAKGVLYIVSPSEYDGLRFRPNFEIKEIVYYPNKTLAFYIISAR